MHKTYGIGLILAKQTDIWYTTHFRTISLWYSDTVICTQMSHLDSKRDKTKRLVLQRVASHAATCICTAVSCSEYLLQCGVVRCSVLQYATHIVTRVCAAPHWRGGVSLRHFHTLCSALRCVAVCCSVLQVVAVCCSVLQCVVVCFDVRHTLGHVYVQLYIEAAVSPLDLYRTHSWVEHISCPNSYHMSEHNLF